MTTIECDGKQIRAEEIEEIGGSLNETMDFTDTLYRDNRGRYFLEQRATIPIPKNAVYQLPRDRGWFDKMRDEEISVKQLSQREALIWYVDSFVNDDRLRLELVRLITAGVHARVGFHIKSPCLEGAVTGASDDL
jgi:hypothetical protein